VPQDHQKPASAGFLCFLALERSPVEPALSLCGRRGFFFSRRSFHVGRSVRKPMEQLSMKTLLIAAEKGGTGRTALLCQLAHYFCLVGKLRVLVIDLAEPACSTVSLARACKAVVLGGQWATALAGEPPRSTSKGCIHVLPACAIHGLTFERGEGGARYHANLRHLLSVVAPFADVCLIDCPPLPDMRAVCVEATVDAMLSPILLSQEAFDSAAELINGVQGVRDVRARLNPSLRFIGLLPNMVEKTPLQQAQARVLQARLSAWLIPDPENPNGYLHMPRLDEIAKAQAVGVSVWDLTHTDHAARTSWRAMRACFDVIARRLDSVETRLADVQAFNREAFHA
jgi:cellulose biosynthesis protein BcsQ